MRKTALASQVKENFEVELKCFVRAIRSCPLKKILLDRFRHEMALAESRAPR